MAPAEVTTKVRGVKVVNLAWIETVRLSFEAHDLDIQIQFEQLLHEASTRLSLTVDFEWVIWPARGAVAKRQQS